MDLSKLPRLSKTDVPPGAPDPEPAGPSARPTGFEVIPTTSAPAPGYCRCGAPLRPGARFCDSCGSPADNAVRALALPYDGGGAGAGAEAWISIAVGVLLVLMAPRIWQYYLTPGSFTWTFSDENGNPLAYRQTVFFWGDLALAAFAVTLILEGVAIALRRRRVLIVALAVTVLATLLNLTYVITMMAQGRGLQILSALAVAFGVYIAIFQWRTLQVGRPHLVRA